MNGHRQTALLLHELGEADRAWLIEQMPEDGKDAVIDMLDELKALRIPTDGNLLARLKTAPAEPTQAAEKTAAADDAAAGGDPLRAASLDRMVALLAHEPAWLIGAVLGLEAWPWREAFLVQLDPFRQQAARASMRNTLGPMLANALRAGLVRRLEELPVTPPQLPQPSPDRSRAASLLANLKTGFAKWQR